MKKPLLLEQCRERFRVLASEYGLDAETVIVSTRVLTPEEAIGRPLRRDYPILEGVERVLEAVIRNTKGQVFTDAQSEFVGRMCDIVNLSLDTHHNRALFLATMNAALAYLGKVKGTVHCKDDAPERCGAALAASLRNTGARNAGLIGFNPALADALVREFGAAHVRITDLNPHNIGQIRFGVTIQDGKTDTSSLVDAVDVILATGTTLVNGTFDAIREHADAAGKRLIVFGVTGAGVCRLMKLDHWCPEAQDG